MITSIIIVKNESLLIAQKIKELAFTQEVIVVDNGSTDDTAKIAKLNKSRVILETKPDFALLRNLAAENATHEWLLYIDVDETIPLDLKHEILEITKFNPDETQPKAYRLLRKNYYLGKLWPHEDGMIRLIYKPALIKWYGQLHETAKINGKVSTLNSRLIHHTHKSIETMLRKTNQWSEVEAHLRFSNKHPKIVSWRLFRVMITAFYNSYIVQKGWRAGTVGVIESIYQSFSIFVTYAKLWELQNKK